MATGIALMVAMLSSSRLFLRSRRDLKAIERYFCEAAGISFSPSVDNVGAHIEPQQLRRFEARIQRVVRSV
jgi:elongation factor P hydroxylase